MRTIERRFDLRIISSQALARYMEYRDVSVRDLAKKVGCSPATIGHLRSGKRDYVNTTWGKKIEDVLEAPRGALFLPELSTVTRDVGPSEKATA